MTPLQRRFPFTAALALAAAGFVLPQARAANPVPLIVQPLGPASVHPGAAGFTLHVRGDGFVTSSVVNWNGSPLVSAFVNSREITAAVPASNVAAAGTAAITVVNPAPKGGPSNTIFLPVIQPLVSNAMTPVATSPTNVNPLAIVNGDFNHDGKLDLITGNQSSNSISVLFGNGNGTFQTAVNYSGVAGQSVWALGTGDFNRDGILDLAVVSDNNAATGYVYLMLGKADGTFQPPGTEMAVGSAPEGIAVGDFNADGNLDLAVSSSDSGMVSIFLGNGDGTFGTRTDYSVGFFPSQIVLGDLNNDGIIDMAVLEPYGFVQTMLGKGDGTFKVSQSLTTDSSPEGLAIGDLNGDGRLDLIVGNSESETISVFLGSGGGSFQPLVDYNAGSGAIGVVLGDFNGDGKLDVAAATDSGLSILLGNGDGTLQNALSYPVANSSGQALVAADFNQDGRLDAAFTNYIGASVTTMLQSTLATTPAALAYNGFQTVGTSSLPLTVTVKNIDGGTLSLGTISLGGADPADFTISSNTCPATLTPAQSCQVKVKFTPTFAGMRTGSLLVTNNTLGVTQTVPLTGYATSVSLSPSNLSFGTVVVGQTGGPLTSTVKNVATVTLNIFKISVGGPNKADFVQSNTCGATLAPGASCTISVTFTPSATGARSASVTINDDGDNGAGNTQSIALSGTGG